MTLPISRIPGISFVQAKGDGGERSVTQYVIIHATDNPTADASDEASYAARREDLTSAHLYVDENIAIQAINLDHIAYGALYNGNIRSIQLELCGVSNRLTEATWKNAAKYVGMICKEYSIPIRKISPDQINDGVKGICGHADVTLAYPQDGGDHMDPGSNFPWDKFLDAVRGVDVALDDSDKTWISEILDAKVWGKKISSPALDIKDMSASDWLKRGEAALREVKAARVALAESATREAALMAAVTALATNGGVDSAPIVTAIQEEAAKTRTLLETKIETLKAERDSLLDRLAEALKHE